MTNNRREFYLGAERASRAAVGLRGAARARAVHSSLPSGEQGETACAAGCAHCCRFPVGVRLSEAAALADAVRADEELRARTLEEAAATRGASWASLTGRRCPLLVDERCARYEARPTPCRALRSFDAARCERALTAPTEVPLDVARWWQGLGAASVLDDELGARELRAGVAALLALDPEATADEVAAAFAAAPTAPPPST